MYSSVVVVKSLAAAQTAAESIAVCAEGSDWRYMHNTRTATTRIVCIECSTSVTPVLIIRFYGVAKPSIAVRMEI